MMVVLLVWIMTAVKLQEQKLSDIESYLHVEYAELIADVEKHFDDDAEFPCCSCKWLFQR